MAFYSDFTGSYEAIFPFRQATATFLDEWLPASGRVLDVGCGTGHYCRHLDGSGRLCTGIDLDPGMIDEAQRLHPAGDFRIMGMEEIGLLEEGTFAGVLCIGNVLPHLPAALVADFLRSVRRLLRPGGIWIVQTVNFDPLLELDEYRFPDLAPGDEGLVFKRTYRDIRPDRLVFATSLERDGEPVFAGETDLYPRTSGDMIAGHRAAGFRLLTHAADWQGHRFLSMVESGSIFVWEKV